MLRLRPYKPCDAAVILKWIRDEEALRKWSADRFGAYPVTAENMNYRYVKCNGECAETDNFYPMTAFDDQGVAGHFILRYTDDKKSTLRLGFVIVDDRRRGQGLGREMLRLAARYAFDLFGAERITLGVFENNPAAHRCYLAAGFRDIPGAENAYPIMGQQWKCLEMEMRTPSARSGNP